MKISVIVASHNRSENLQMFLKSIDNQKVPDGSDWEVFIVDNNSSDDTKDATQLFIQRNPGKFRYIFEKKLGKSLALNAGICAAHGDVLVFTDDDCIPDSGWLGAIVNEFASDPSLFVLGGRVELYCKEDRPITIRTHRERISFCSLDQLFSLIPGCNMAFRRSVFDAVGDFDPVLGPGARVEAAEDIEFLYRVFKKGFKIVYCPDVLVYHNHGRRTDAQVQALNHKYVVGRGAFYCKYILRADLSVLKMAYWEISSLISGLLKERFSGEAAEKQETLLRDLLIGALYIPSALRWHLGRRFARRLPA